MVLSDESLEREYVGDHEVRVSSLDEPTSFATAGKVNDANSGANVVSKSVSC